MTTVRWVVVFTVFSTVILTACGEAHMPAVTPRTPTVETGRPEGPGEPVLSLAEEDYDFGAIPTGKTVEHDFVLSNTGKGQLKLGRVEAMAQNESC